MTEAAVITMDNSDKLAAESLIPLFQFRQSLNLDQNGRRLSLLGSIHDRPALLCLERAAFPTDPKDMTDFLSTIANITNLGANDIYHWYMANHYQQSAPAPLNTVSVPGKLSSTSSSSSLSHPDLKLNLIYPCTDQHIKKYSPQLVRMVTETPSIYSCYVRPYMQHKRDEGRLNWVFNIIEGRTEQQDVILRERGGARTGANDDSVSEGGEGFLLLPDLNWDRKTIESLHLLALVERRDLWSLRDLKKRHVVWLKHMREKLVKAAVRIYGDKGVEEDMLKLYVHYQPTYYHFHIHIVNVMLEAGSTQATGKAFGLENLISQLECMGDKASGEGYRGLGTGGTADLGEDDGQQLEVEPGMADVSLTYFLGEASELWQDIFKPLKEGRFPMSSTSVIP